MSEIITDDTGVQINWLIRENESGPKSFSWTSILAVKAFKRENYTLKRIYLAIETPAGRTEVHENMNGWEGLLDALKRHLPNFPPLQKWCSYAKLPVIEVKEKELWNQEKAQRTEDVQSGPKATMTREEFASRMSAAEQQVKRHVIPFGIIIVSLWRCSLFSSR